MKHSQLIISCDFNSARETFDFVKKINPSSCRLKIGSILFTQSGPKLIEKLQQQGFEIFLDLKFHDIPNTVAGSVRAAAQLGVWMCNVHSSGGREMLIAAVEALDRFHHKPLLIGVTVLTSFDQAGLAAIGITADLAQQVFNLAQLAYDCGLNGVVCSGYEASLIHQHCPKPFLCVTPGIRLDDQHHDQKRVMTPLQALHAGSDYLVIGRAITQAPDPNQRIEEINLQLCRN
ncbi:MAG: orotidine-5'-phosphate decarboxylase [Legionellales bacterium]|nr:orotidine-5'-phosphate decarboxylase [Legionellales bacterium]